MVSIDNFKRETECTYKDDRYSVRDNGAVLRHARKGKRLRKYDDQWFFGNQNTKTGYMEIASARIHRIVATAFHGEPPTKQHVVDHKDTNKKNNRPENLRWVTRLENILLNPITVKRIEIACECSVEEFLADPSKFRDKFREPNYSWMCAVTVEAAQISLKRMQDWAKSDKLPVGGTLGEWIYKRNLQNQYVEETLKATDMIKAKTLNAVQMNWKTPSEFPCCPQENSVNPITTYFLNLKNGEIFSRNQYSISIIKDFAISKDENTLWVMCKNSDESAVKPWSLAQVTYENDLFVHSSLRSFFKLDSAEKYFTLGQGLEWKGGDNLDDLC